MRAKPGGRPLRVGLLTTWNERCGVSEYSRALAGALRARGHAVAVLANHPANPVPWAGAVGSERGVHRFFYTGWHRERGADAGLAPRVAEELRLDLVHLQYQNFIYPADVLPVLDLLADRVPLVATFHDAGVPPEFPRHRVTRAIVHNAVTARMLAWPGAAVVPIGIHEVPAPPVEEARRRLGVSSRPVLCSLGLGRTDYRAVLAALGRVVPRYPDLLWVVLGPEGYTDAVSVAAAAAGLARHLRPLGGFHPLPVLFAWLHAADISLFYFPETGIEGVSSSSARLGIAGRRPVVASDVGWLGDLPAELKVPPGDPEALSHRLFRLLEDPGFRQRVLARQEELIRHQGWSRAAARHEEIYRETLARAG